MKLIMDAGTITLAIGSVLIDRDDPIVAKSPTLRHT